MSIDEKRYEHVTSMCRYHNDKIIEAFNLYIKLVTLIVGGVVWLRVQAKTIEGSVSLDSIEPLAADLLFIVSGCAIWLIIINLYAWLGFRNAEHSSYRASDGKQNTPEPRRLRDYWNEWFYVILILFIFVLLVSHTIAYEHIFCLRILLWLLAGIVEAVLLCKIGRKMRFPKARPM